MSFVEPVWQNLRTQILLTGMSRYVENIFTLRWWFFTISINFKRIFFKICDFFYSSSFSCWAIDVSVNWIYKIPCIVSVCANLIFLLVIVFKLVSNFYTDMSDNAAVMRTFKAIGMNYIIFVLSK